MNLNKTDITIVLDRSGSMSDCRQETINAVNEFVKGQCEGVGSATVSLVQFDTRYEPNYTAVDVKEVKPLDNHSYQPRGGTALLEAIGRTIEATGARLRAIPEHERPGTVLFVIQTDGEENSSSRDWAADNRVQKMIEHQRDVYKWDFIFLGAGIDAIASAAKLGLARTSALSYDKGLSRATFRKMSDNTNTLRSAKSFGLMANYEVSEEDRKEATGK